MIKDNSSNCSKPDVKALQCSRCYLPQGRTGGPRSTAHEAEALGLSQSMGSEKGKGSEGWEHKGWQGRDIFQGCM